MITPQAHFRTIRAATATSGGVRGDSENPVAQNRLKPLGRLLPLAAAALTLLLATGCAHLAIDKHGTWTGPLPQPVTVKEAARIEPPWYGKVVAPFVITLFSGSRVGLEYNDGRIVRTSEYLRGVPYVGYLVMPYFCYEALKKETMQGVANKSGIDKRRERKYKAIINRLEQDGRTEEAVSLKAHNPFDVANHPPNPQARMPRENLKGTKGVIKTLWVELAIGHRNSLERNESRGVRKLEYWHPLVVTRLWEAFEAGAGLSMEDIAEKEHLDERYLPKPTPEVTVTARPRLQSPRDLSDGESRMVRQK